MTPAAKRAIERDTDDLSLVKPKAPEPQRVAASRYGAVATAHFDATAAAVEILEDGGNAMDAAAAAAFALGVCEPAASGLGGQTMMLVHLAETRQTIAIDGSSRTPNRLNPGMLTKREMRRGYRATTVPSTPAALEYVRDRYGALPLSRVLEPAIRLAKNGSLVTELQSRLTRRELKALRAGTAAPFFLRDGTRVMSPGSLLTQPVLAGTLERLAAEGIEDFYQGEIAAEIERDMVAHEGLLRRDDLAHIPWPVERRPVSGRYAGSRVLTMPPPGAGRTLVELLNIASNLPARKFDPDTPVGAVMLAETIRRALIDRRDRPFDPNYYASVDDRQLTSEAHAQRLAKLVRKRAETHGETTHLSVVDKAGNAVALTQSIERVYGSCSVTPSLGFLYNDYISAFEHEDISHPYYLRPNGHPWASVAPSIVMRRGKPWLVIGSPGSERICSSILQVILRLQRQSPMDAVSAPRLHCSLGGRVSLEATRMRTDIPTALKARGFEIDEREPFAFYLGCVQLVLKQGNEWVGVADLRRDGAAGVPSQ